MNTNYKFYEDHKFLIIDDDLRLREQAIGVLVELGFKGDCITEAENGKIALDKINAGDTEYDFFLIDLVMPEMNGLEFLKELSKIEKYKDTPKLVLSGESDSNIVLNAIAAGAHGYMNKPCDRLTLAKKLFECAPKEAEATE